MEYYNQKEDKQVEPVDDDNKDDDNKSDNSHNSDNQELMDNFDDDFNADHTTKQSNILAKIDRKIIIKFMKEGKTSRTYIFGLDQYIYNKDDILKFIKPLQKSIGTSLIEKLDEDNKLVFGFGGNHIQVLYDAIIKKNICPKNEIKKQ